MTSGDAGYVEEIFVAKNGVYCVSYYTGEGETANASISSRKLSWHSETEWNGNFSNDDSSGLEMLGETFGRVDEPNVDSTSDSDGHLQGETIITSWY